MRLLSLALFTLAAAQHAGTGNSETHLQMPIQHCTKAGGCKFEKTSTVLDSNWRWTHAVGCTNSSKCNCFLGNHWVNSTCSSSEECTHTCALDGEDVKGVLAGEGARAVVAERDEGGARPEGVEDESDRRRRVSH